MLCGDSHDLEDCRRFMEKSLDERTNFVKEKQLCFGCFSSNHIVKGCKQRRTCQTCKKRHPSSLHDINYHPKLIPGKKDADDQSSDQEGSATSFQALVGTQFDTVFQAILPVKVREPNTGKSLITYALLDNGSTGCFVTDELKNSLGGEVTETSLKLLTLSGVNYAKTDVLSDLIVTDVNDNNPVTLPKTYIKRDIPVTHH